jgi:hypothetical protein
MATRIKSADRRVGLRDAMLTYVQSIGLEWEALTWDDGTPVIRILALLFDRRIAAAWLYTDGEFWGLRWLSTKVQPARDVNLTQVMPIDSPLVVKIIGFYLNEIVNETARTEPEVAMTYAFLMASISDATKDDDLGKLTGMALQIAAVAAKLDPDGTAVARS